MLTKLIEMLQNAIAPARMWLEMLETIMAMFECLNSIPKAIISLNPKPIFDCLKNLVKKIARLLSAIPPMSYVKMAVDVLKICTWALGQILEMLKLIANRLTQLINTLRAAALLGDESLLTIAACGSADMKPMVLSIFDVILIILIPVEIVLRPLTNFINNPQIEQAVSLRENIKERIDQYRDGVNNIPADQLAAALGPVLGPVVEVISKAQMILVIMHNVVAPLVGADQIPFQVAPSYTNW